jgi:hypothetical protein
LFIERFRGAKSLLAGSVFLSVHYAINASGARRETAGGDATVPWRW